MVVLPVIFLLQFYFVRELLAAGLLRIKGYRIVAAPVKASGQFRIAGTIEKDTPDGVKRYEFIRADVYANWDDAVAVTTSKAKQIIDQEGDRLFK